MKVKKTSNRKIRRMRIQTEVMKFMRENPDREYFDVGDIITFLDSLSIGKGSWNSITSTALGHFMAELIRRGLVERIHAKSNGRDYVAYRLAEQSTEEE